MMITLVRRFIGLFILSITALPAAPVTLLVTGKTLGLLEHCGCRKTIEGGLEARAGFIKKFRVKNPDCLLLDVGSFFPPKNKPIDPKYRLPNEDRILEAIAATNLEAMRLMKYDAILPGFNDLAYGLPFLKRVFGTASPPIAANVLQRSREVSLFTPSTILTVQNMKLGVIGAPSLRDGRKPCRDFTIANTSKRITEAIEAMCRKTALDAVILLVNEPPPTVTRWLATYQGPKIDLIVTLDFGIEVKKVGDTYIANAPGRGRAVGKIDLEIVEGKGIVSAAYERISLDPKRYTNRPVRDFLTQAYQRMTNDLGLEPDAPAVLMTFDREMEESNGYVGSEDCRGCHEDQYEQWVKTKHAQAFDILLDNNRHWVPRFAMRHVTGYGHTQGYKGYSRSARLAGVQCEACHGPGRTHILDPENAPLRRIPSLELCAQCHSPDFDPKFHSRSDLYTQQIQH